MGTLKRCEDMGQGKPKGSITSKPQEIDSILRRAWGKIFHGNEGDLEASAAQVMSKYQKYIVKLPEFQIAKIDAEEFKTFCRNSESSAAGLDGWSARDIAILSDHALDWLIRLLDQVEEGKMQWPEHMLVTRAVFLSKDPDDTDNPMKYRILKITSAIYRKWASYRTQCLQAWIQQWVDEAINSGVPGKGAQDAWMSPALAVEITRLAGEEIAGGSVDVFKCFDQINRELIYKLAEAAGMPKRILNPYFQYINNLEIKYQVGKTIGEGHRHRCSIPQGCPFSKTMVALLMMPWASNKSARFFLNNFSWDQNGTKIPCSSSFRDLGAHLNCNQSYNGVTLTNRMDRAAQMARKLAWMPMDLRFKEKIVLCNIIPAALYGADAVHVNQAALHRLRTAIAKAIGPASAKRNIDIVFANARASKDLDPETHILFNRVVALRRMMAKHKNKQGMIRIIIRMYNNGHHMSTKDANAHIKNTMWKHAKSKQSKRGEPNIEERFEGPVGFLIHNLRQYKCTLRDDLTIVQENEADIHIWNMPIQHLKIAVMQIPTRHRIQRASKSRTYCGEIQEIDDQIMKEILQNLGEKEKRIYTHINTGAFWHEGQLHSIDEADGKCRNCGAHVQDAQHILWNCPEVNKYRHLGLCQNIVWQMLPKCIRMGLPCAMTKDFDRAFWDYKDQYTNTNNNMHDTKCGCPNGRTQTRIAESEQHEIDSILNNNNISPNVNARQAFNQLRQYRGSVGITMPAECHEPAPIDINVYTDGS